MKELILASTSPRRKEILSLLGIPFTVIPSNYEEDMTLPLSPEKLVQHLALGKAQAVADPLSDAIVIGSDTFVSCNGKILGKPHTPEKAKAMLRMLSGKKHTLYTGLAIIDTEAKKTITDFTTTDIYFADMTDEDINDYVATKEPLDRAGAYALQEKGALYITRLDGDYFSAIGLPLRLVAKYLKELGVFSPRS